MLPGADDPIGVALEVAAAIESVGGAYFIGDSVASSLQGEPRATNDIDIVMKHLRVAFLRIFTLHPTAWSPHPLRLLTPFSFSASTTV